ncbi:WecB/TagA/CpsF family glycosyltransferase [Salinarimonas sp.]|uniref:WecB/TagA/CpsF family glycosyltransferase n=1 Tax=Salinarimonas sp. TaxID=2766526 RepID=UPI0032D960D2
MEQAPVDALERKVFCLLGIPVDAVSMEEALARLARPAAAERALLSTPNLNFLVSSLSDPDFRETLRMSDFCPADGLSLVWLARLLRIPLPERVAGSDIFDALVSRDASPPLRVFLFGGDAGVAEAAASRLNDRGLGVRCVGWLDPGRGSVEEMSRPEIIARINESDADFLVVALGATKGQKWLAHNRDALAVPLRSHLGAVVNFHAGAVRRAPPRMRAAGLEWLWRIKEEPRLWRRYAHDGLALVAIVGTRVGPLRLLDALIPVRGEALHAPSCIVTGAALRIALAGDPRLGGLEAATAVLRSALPGTRHAEVDLADLRFLDPRTLGLLLVLRKILRDRGGGVRLTNATAPVRTLLRLHAALDLAA